MNKYPIYVISKGRSDLKRHTSRFLFEEGVSHKIVVEPQEFEAYAKRFGEENILTLPFSNLGQGSIPARNWVWEHSLKNGDKRHWILDDNIAFIATLKKGKRIKCDSKIAFEGCEKFIDRFSNIAIGGMSYWFFGFVKGLPPYYLNSHVYSCLCIKNDLDFRWRGRYNEDTDLCLQALTKNWCTVNINAFLTYKATTMTCKGGNMEELYQGNGRLKMARSLEYQWMGKLPPGTVKTIWRFNRPQHHVNWKVFKTQLKEI